MRVLENGVFLCQTVFLYVVFFFFSHHTLCGIFGHNFQKDLAFEVADLQNDALIMNHLQGYCAGLLIVCHVCKMLLATDYRYQF